MTFDVVFFSVLWGATFIVLTYKFCSEINWTDLYTSLGQFVKRKPSLHQ